MIITARVLINLLRVLIGLGGIVTLIILSVAIEGVWDGTTWLVGSVLVIGVMIGAYIATRIEFEDRSRTKGD